MPSLPYSTQAGVRTDGCCPMCPVHQPPIDNAAHILGACSHPPMQELIINLHNKAALMIHAAVMADSTLTMAVPFIPSSTSGTRAPFPGAHATRIPKWILPAILDAERARLRPDMLIIHHPWQGLLHGWARKGPRCSLQHPDSPPLLAACWLRIPDCVPLSTRISGMLSSNIEAPSASGTSHNASTSHRALSPPRKSCTCQSAFFILRLNSVV